MAQGVDRLVSGVGLPSVDALKLAITVPVEVIGRPDLGRVTGRSLKDMLLLNERCQVISFCGV